VSRGPTQTFAEKREALESLLPLLEAELEGGGGEEKPWEPKPNCRRSCLGCIDSCKELPLLVVYRQLRAAYPQLRQLEHLLEQLMQEHANWAAALYWVYVQPWDAFERSAGRSTRQKD
jgi:hypothetical protein